MPFVCKKSYAEIVFHVLNKGQGHMNIQGHSLEVSSEGHVTLPSHMNTMKMSIKWYKIAANV